LIPDGAGGVILHTNIGGGGDEHRRIDAGGNILWTRYDLSWYASVHSIKMVASEENIFYMGFRFVGYGEVAHVWGQRVDMRGDHYWPTWPEQRGAMFNLNVPEWEYSGGPDYKYKLYNFYALHLLREPDMPYPKTHKLYISVLDTTGNRVLGDEGFLIHRLFGWSPYDYTDLVLLDDGGMAAVFERDYFPSSSPRYSVLAKRANPDGSLGGPLHLLVELIPENPQIQIPAQGGSFHFDVAIADTYEVESKFDSWIEVTLPNGDTREIALREGLHLEPQTVISHGDLVQNVPSWAPTGEYTYTLYVGDHDYPEWYWANDSFEFEKLEGSESETTLGGWHLAGWDRKERLAKGEADLPEEMVLVHSYPNPFNPTTVLSYKLQVACFVRLEIYDVSGRLVESPLHHVWREAGIHEVVFDGSTLASGIYLYRLEAGGFETTGKMILIR
jgi:hypothetical protein